MFLLRPIFENLANVFWAIVASYCIWFPSPFGDLLERACGRVVTRLMKDGKYEFYGFVSTPGVLGTTYITPQTIESIPFEVKSRLTIYLGHLHYTTQYFIGLYSLTVEDRRKRDILKLRRVYSRLKYDNIEYKIAKYRKNGHPLLLRGIIIK